MENAIQIFNNEQFGAIRTIEENGKVLFCGSDVAKALGYSNTKDALSRHCKEDGVAFHDLIDSMGREQQAKFINEGNVYRLITHSKLPAAEQFEHWVFDEVLPTLRKTGGYISSSEQMLNTYFVGISPEQRVLVGGLLRSIEVQQKKIEDLTMTNEILTAEVLTWATRPLVNALIRRYSGRACGGIFGFAWTDFKRELLYKYGININARITNYMNKTNKKTKPKTLNMIADDEVLFALKTIVSLCETQKIDISDLLTKYKSIAAEKTVPAPTM